MLHILWGSVEWAHEHLTAEVKNVSFLRWAFPVLPSGCWWLALHCPGWRLEGNAFPLVVSRMCSPEENAYINLPLPLVNRISSFFTIISDLRSAKCNYFHKNRFSYGSVFCFTWLFLMHKLLIIKEKERGSSRRLKRRVNDCAHTHRAPEHHYHQACVGCVLSGWEQFPKRSSFLSLYNLHWPLCGSDLVVVFIWGAHFPFTSAHLD